MGETSIFGTRVISLGNPYRVSKLAKQAIYVDLSHSVRMGGNNWGAGFPKK